MSAPDFSWIRQMNTAQRKLVFVGVFLLAIHAAKTPLFVLLPYRVFGLLSFLWWPAVVLILYSMWREERPLFGDSVDAVWWITARLGGALVACWLALRVAVLAGLGAALPSLNLWLMADAAGDVALGVASYTLALWSLRARKDV